MCSNISNYVPRLDFFLKTCPEYVDADIPGISELPTRVKTVEASEPSEVPDVTTWETEEQEIGGNGDAKCGNCSSTCMIQQELKKWLKVQELGLDMGYRCRECRKCLDCKKGSGSRECQCSRRLRLN